MLARNLGWSSGFETRSWLGGLLPALLLLTAASWAGAGDARAATETLGFTLTQSASSSSLVVEVLDEQTETPLADAKVVIADTLASKPNASGWTDFAGREILRPRPNAAQALTVSKEGYLTFSLVGVGTGKITVFLKELRPASKNVIASGTFGGFAGSLGGSVVAAGVVFKSLSAMDLLSFQIESFVSPLRDTVDVMGPRQIPSNLVLPDQTVSLPLGGVRLNKPDYRLPLQSGHPVRLSGVQGQVRVSDLLPLLQNSGSRPSLEILNKLKFQRVGLSSESEPTESFREDFDAILSLNPNKHQVAPSRPPYTADVIVTAATDLRGDRSLLIPTDIKTAGTIEKPGVIQTVQLAAPAQNLGKARDVITIAISSSGHRITGIITDQAPQSPQVIRPGEFLNAPELPNFSSLPTQVKVQAPTKGLGAAVFYSAYPVWIVYTLPSAGEITVPTVQLPGVADREGVTQYAVSQLDFGQAFDERTVEGKSLLRKMERFTRSQAKRLK